MKNVKGGDNNELFVTCKCKVGMFTYCDYYSDNTITSGPSVDACNSPMISLPSVCFNTGSVSISCNSTGGTC
ncbi:MAG: hypothetical protein QM528_08330 [Phycisphaerales bacterium]|nr:hypothetical protein [Phycisphaerales bacterium]MDI9358940.1 hypothetical protein [Phycisphaerales bacterium]